MFQEGVGASHTSLRILQYFFIIIVVFTMELVLHCENRNLESEKTISVILSCLIPYQSLYISDVCVLSSSLRPPIEVADTTTPSTTNHSQDCLLNVSSNLNNSCKCLVRSGPEYIFFMDKDGHHILITTADLSCHS